MKIKIPKADFLRGLRLAASVADKKATLPILGSALLRADRKTGLTVGATDLTVSAVATLAAQVEKDGAIAIGARQIFDVVRELPGEEVQMSVDTATRRTTLRAGRAEFTLPGTDAKDYPKLPDPAEPGSKVDATVLREMLQRTLFSAALDDTRPLFAAVLFESQGGKAICVSTDGHRLSKVGRDLAGAPDCRGVLVPRKAVREILGVLDGREAPVGLSVSGDRLAVRVDDVGLWVKLTEGSFVPYEQIIPTDFQIVAVVSRTDLMEAIRRATIMSDSKNSITLTVADGLVRVEVENPEAGNAKDEITARTKGGTLAVGANASYLRDWLSAASSQDIKILLSGEIDPIVLRPDDDTDYVGVVMPMRI